MTFNSITFAAFFVVVLLVYRRLGLAGQNRLMVLAGAIFYGAFDVRFLALLYFSLIVDYLVGRSLGATDDQRRRKQLVSISFISQLGILGFFKYYDFFVSSAEDLLSSFGFHVSPPILDVAVPVGISFYTFQTLAYVVAVYRGKMEPERDVATFATYVSWFPQLAAGPIARATTLLPQLRVRRPAPAAAVAESAVGLILQGLLKKVVVADTLGEFVTGVYGAPGDQAALPLALATVGFALQVYGDFSGYSDIARGTSRLLGVELRRNFEQPFLSRNMQEFWQRWHTTLSWWFLDIVGRPLMRMRLGPNWGAYVTVAVFALIGLWHGAAWTFVLWGLVNGVLVVIWQRRPIREGQDPERVRFRDAHLIAFTFLLFASTAILFRAGSIEDAATVFERILTLSSGQGPPAEAFWIPVMACLVLLLDLAERRRRVAALEEIGMRTAMGSESRPPEIVREGILAGLSPLRAGLVFGVVVVAVIIFSGGTVNEFIYFQF